MKKYQKIILIIPASFLTLILLVVAGTAFVFRNEISIYSSIRQLRPANREVLQGGINDAGVSCGAIPGSSGNDKVSDKK